MLGVPAAVSFNQVETNMIRLLLSDRRGVASIEYGILAVGIIAAVTLAIGVFSVDLQAAFGALGDQLKAAM